MEPTSNNAHKSARKKHSDKSSDEYLSNQIADAKLALESTLEDLTLDLAQAADLRRWVRRYPWAALGTALVAGFTVAHFVTKSKRRESTTPEFEEQLPVDRLSNVEAGKPVKKAQAVKEPASGWRLTIINGLFEILRLAVTQFVSASVRQAAQHPPAAGRDGSAATSSPTSDVDPKTTDAHPDIS